MIRTLAQLKQLFRQKIKVVPGGPPVGTVGSNRAQGQLDVLDALAEDGQPDALLAKINVAASAAAGVHVSVVNNLLVFSLSATPPPSTPVITPGPTTSTPVITVFTTTAY